MRASALMCAVSSFLLGSQWALAETSPEQLYADAIDAAVRRIYIGGEPGRDRDVCPKLSAQIEALDDYAPRMTDPVLRGHAVGRFRPFLEHLHRKSCTRYGVLGKPEDYEAMLLANTPAADFLTGTPLLQAMVERSPELDGLLEALNAERRAQGLADVIVADYPNSVVGGTSTIVLFRGWPGRPRLDQWLQIQRTVDSMFFIALEPQADGSYVSGMRGSDLSYSGGMPVISPKIGEITSVCLGCHFSGKPLSMPALEDNPVEAAKVATLLGILRSYPARTHDPVFNPPADFPGIGAPGANTACDQCHNGRYQNKLQAPLAASIWMLMANGFMPPGQTPPMSDAARDEALRVLTSTYRTRLKSYFRGMD